jgi:hypothetical protein
MSRMRAARQISRPPSTCSVLLEHAPGVQADAEAMSHGRHTPFATRHLAWLSAAARTTAAERERCAAIVERWNEQPTYDWSPAIGTALKAHYRWLDVYCAGCRQVKPIDLAAVDIHRRRV